MVQSGGGVAKKPVVEKDAHARSGIKSFGSKRDPALDRNIVKAKLSKRIQVQVERQLTTKVDPARAVSKLESRIATRKLTSRSSKKQESASPLNTEALLDAPETAMSEFVSACLSLTLIWQAAVVCSSAIQGLQPPALDFVCVCNA